MSDTNNNNQQFLLGLFGGIALVAVIGLVILGIAFIRATDNDSRVAGVQNTNPVGNNNDVSGAPVAQDLQITGADHIRGNVDAPITILEWSDVQCPYCSRFHDAMNQILADFPNDVHWVFRSFPLDSIHQYARKGAEALECANDQGKFWEFNDEVYARQSEISAKGVAIYKEVASGLGLNAKDFNSCLDDGKYADVVESQLQSGIAAGVQGTPGSFLNGQSLGGAVPYDSLKAQIQALLK